MIYENSLNQFLIESFESFNVWACGLSLFFFLRKSKRLVGVCILEQCGWWCSDWYQTFLAVHSSHHFVLATVYVFLNTSRIVVLRHVMRCPNVVPATLVVECGIRRWRSHALECLRLGFIDDEALATLPDVEQQFEDNLYTCDLN